MPDSTSRVPHRVRRDGKCLYGTNYREDRADEKTIRPKDGRDRKGGEGGGKEGGIQRASVEACRAGSWS